MAAIGGHDIILRVGVVENAKCVLIVDVIRLYPYHLESGKAEQVNHYCEASGGVAGTFFQPLGQDDT
jgi:hypothetical protein